MDKNNVISIIKDHEAVLDLEKPVICGSDQAIMNEMIREINLSCDSSVKLRGFSDVSDLYVRGAGEIVAGYVNRFTSHIVRTALLFHLVGDRKYSCSRIENCESMIWNLYIQYKNSPCYINNSVQMDFDEAFVKMKSKKIMDEMLSLAQSPLDFCWLPRTMLMLARWKIPSVGELLEYYVDHPEVIQEQLRNSDISGRYSDEESIQKLLSRWNGQGRYTAIIGLKYFPSQRVVTKLKLLEAQIDAQLKEKLSAGVKGKEKISIKDDYSGRLKTIRQSISFIEKELLKQNHSPN